MSGESGSGPPAGKPQRSGVEEFFNPLAEPPPERAWVEADGRRFSKGVRVRLRPRRSADSLDIFLSGRTARVESVERDLEDRAYVAVAVDDGPAGDAYGSCGRLLYFHPDELELVESGATAPAED